MHKDIIYREISKRKNCDEAKEEALAMYELYNELAATLDDEQKICLKSITVLLKNLCWVYAKRRMLRGLKLGSKNANI